MACCGSPGCRFLPHTSGQFQNFCCIACYESRGHEHGPRCQRKLGPSLPRPSPPAPKASRSNSQPRAPVPGGSPSGQGGADWAAQIRQTQERNAQAERLRAEQRGDEEPEGAVERSPGAVWQERQGYRMKAPNERTASETRRISQKDEAELKKLKAQKEAQAREIIRQSQGGVLGSGSSSSDMHAGRMALVDKLERESDPKFRRLQKKEDEKQQREKDQRQREIEEEKRQEEWRQRQQRQSVVNRDLNERKKNHWQAQDDQIRAGSQGAVRRNSTPAASSSSSSAPVQRPCVPEEPPVADPSQLIGRWLYGSKPNEYHIESGSDGLLHFRGVDPAGGWFRSLLHRSTSGHYEAQLVSSDGTTFGSMRFAVIGERQEAVLVSNFKKFGKPDWGKDNLARRATPSDPPAAEVVDPAPRQPAKPPIVVDDERDGVRAPMETGYEDRLIDPDVWQCWACTLINEPKSSCCSACGNARPRRPAPTPVLTISPQTPTPTPTAVPEVSSPSVSEPPPPADPFLAWLQSHRLEEYHDALLENGFEDPEDLRAAEQSELDGLFDLLGVKPGHMLKFRRALRGGGQGGGPRECPVCLLGPQEGVNVVLTPCGHVFCGEHALKAHSQGCCPVCRSKPTATQRIFA